MKFLILALAVACAAADVPYVKPNDYAFIPIIKSEYQINKEGNAFNYAYETGSGIKAQVEGVVTNTAPDTSVLTVRGAYDYVAPDGTPVHVSYVAGDEGFKAEGSHIPVPPPIPEAILRSLAYIESHKPYVETQVSNEKVYKKF